MLESSQAHATVTNNGICPTLTASMEIGGGYVPMIVAYGFEPGVAKRLNVESRFYEECCPTLRENAGDNQASVVVIENEKSIRNSDQG